MLLVGLAILFVTVVGVRQVASFERALANALLGWDVDEPFRATTHRAVGIPVGAVLGLAALHVLNAFAEANALIASSLLGPDRSDTDG